MHGVSRPTIKKVGSSAQRVSLLADGLQFVDSKYHLSMNAAATSQLNRAITHGTNSGNFVLPKGWFFVHQSRRTAIALYVGPSGKVKLAPKKLGEIAKEVNMHHPRHFLLVYQCPRIRNLPRSVPQ